MIFSRLNGRSTIKTGSLYKGWIIHSLFLMLSRCDPAQVMVFSFLRFLDHTQRRTTVGRTPLDEWSAHLINHYLTTYNTHNRQTSMPPVGFESTISAGERPQTYALDRAATGTGFPSITQSKFRINYHWNISYYRTIMDASRNMHHATCITHLVWTGRVVTKHILIFQQGTSIFPPCLRMSMEPSPPRIGCLSVCMQIVFPKFISIKFGKTGQNRKLSRDFNFGSCRMTLNRS
jgi:hypothetical protein